MSVSQTEVSGLYLAYFGRPADPNGLAFYTGIPSATIAAVSAAFSGSAESQSLYGAFGYAQINAIYQNLFNRDAEQAGLTYWYNEVTSGRVSPAGAAYAILLGAQNEDKVTVQNKLQACAAFTAQLDMPGEILGYSGDTAAARARGFIHTVDSSSGSLAAALADVGAQVAYTTGQSAGTFAVTKDAANVVSFAHAGAYVAVTLLPSGGWSFTTMGGGTGSGTASGAIAGISVPAGTTLTISSALAGAKAFTGAGKTVVVANANGENLATALAGTTGVGMIELSAGHDYTLTASQAAIAQFGASGAPGKLIDSGKITVIDALATLAGGAAAALRAQGVDRIVATVAASADISAISMAGIDALQLVGATKYAMTSAQAALLTTSPGAQVVTLTDAATKLLLSPEVETFKLASGVANSVIMGAIDQAVIGTSGDDDLTPISGVTSTVDLGSGTNVIRVTAGADISGGTFKAAGGSLEYNVDAATTARMTVAQASAIGSAVGAQNIALADAASGITLNKDVETFTLGDFANVVYQGAKGQAIVGGAKNDTVHAIDGVTSTSDLKGGANSVIVADGYDISGGAFLATGGTIGFILDGVSTATLSAVQAGQVTSATGNQTVKLGTAANGVTLSAAIESFILGNFTNTVTLGAAAQNVKGNAGIDTVIVGDLAATGTLDGGTGTADKLVVGGTLGAATISNFEILSVTADSDVSAANGGGAVGTTTLTMNAGMNLTMTIAQNEGMKASASVSGAGQSVSLTGAGTATAIAGIETYILAAGANTIATSTAGQTINANALSASDVLTLTGSVAAKVTLVAGSLDASGYTGALSVVATTGNNVIKTGSGADVVIAGSGNNTVTLGAGADILVLNSLSGVTTVTDFDATATGDKIQLSKSVYATLGSLGTLGASAFEAGAGLTAAATAAGRIVYNSSTGDLYYDSDGSGAASAVLIGTLSNKPTLTASLFSIIS